MLGIGAGHALGVAVLSALAVVFVGGPEYADLQGRLWGFAVLGTLLSMIQLMVYEVVARQCQRMVLVVWTTLLLLVCAAPFVGGLSALLAVVVTLDAMLFLLLLVVSLRSRPS